MNLIKNLIKNFNEECNAELLIWNSLNHWSTKDCECWQEYSHRKIIINESKKRTV